LKSCKSRDAIINSFWSCIGGKRIDTWYFWSVRNFPDANAWDGLNFLWTQFDSILDLKVWMAAAGQIFFTLSVGMGTIHCYAAYIDAKDDIALNAVSTGFMNEFVEVVLGSLIVIPIAAGYLGLDWVIQNAGFEWLFKQCRICLNNGVLL
jgi:SNF family Na+-dependent transporter